MVHLKKITAATPQLFEQILPIYLSSFPEIERRTPTALKELIAHQTDMNPQAIFKGAALCGVLITWDFEDFKYIEHLAVAPEFRNQKIGEQVLQRLEKDSVYPLLLEVEPAEDELSERRIGFYERNGFQIVEKEYRQLPYEKGGKSIQLWIMSNHAYKDKELLMSQIYTLKEKVYARFWD